VEGPFGPQRSFSVDPYLVSALGEQISAHPWPVRLAPEPPGVAWFVQAAARDPASCKPSALTRAHRIRGRGSQPGLPGGCCSSEQISCDFSKSQDDGSGEVPTRRARPQAIESAGYGSAVHETAKRQPQCGIPFVGSPTKFASNSFDRLRLREEGGPPLRRSARQFAPITRHAGQITTRIETLRRQAIEGTASTLSRVALPRAASATRKVRIAGPTKVWLIYQTLEDQVGNGLGPGRPGTGSLRTPVGSPSWRNLARLVAQSASRQRHVRVS